MTSRSIRSRIGRLEKIRKATDEILVVWRRPGGDVAEAVASVCYAPGDRVICLEWYGEGLPPAPKRHRDLRGLGEEEDKSIEIMLNRVLDAKPDRKEVADNERRCRSNPDLDGYSDEDLLYILCGVPDGRMIRESLRN
jgi:hypothetical protein